MVDALVLKADVDREERKQTRNRRQKELNQGEHI